MSINFKNFNEFDKIFVLVSGGIDSTYLYELFKKQFNNKVFPVNCYNPFEQSKTLTQISKESNFIQIKPDKKYNYQKILKESFLKIPEANSLRIIQKKYRKLIKELYQQEKITKSIYNKEIKKEYYHKKIFPCCYYIKHKAFLNDKLFQTPNTVVISGIKRGDGTQRRIFLTLMKKGTFKSLNPKKPSFFLKHKTKQLYCYPFRDYTIRELPKITINKLKKKYPNITHSGCSICPVLVLFNIKKENRYKASLNYAQKLKIKQVIK